MGSVCTICQVRFGMQQTTLASGRGQATEESILGPHAKLGLRTRQKLAAESETVIPSGTVPPFQEKANAPACFAKGRYVFQLSIGSDR